MGMLVPPSPLDESGVTPLVLYGGGGTPDLLTLPSPLDGHTKNITFPHTSLNIYCQTKIHCLAVKLYTGNLNCTLETNPGFGCAPPPAPKDPLVL